MFNTLLPVMAPVAISIFIGFIWRKMAWPYDTEMVTRLIMWVGAPCLIVSTLVKTDVSQAVLESMAWVSLAVVGATLLLCWIMLKITRQPVRDFLGPLTFPNAGNMGLPVCLFAFGNEGLVLALAVFMVLSLVHFTVGIALVSGRSVVREMVSNPIIYSIALAVGVIYTDLSLPRWVANTVGLLGDITIPMMLLTLGVSLASMNMNSLFKGGFWGTVRLAVGVLVGWGVATAFQLQGVTKGVVIIQSAMPVAIFNYLFAMRYGRSPQVVASMVMVSTLLSFALIPLLLVYVI
ncbi:MAG: AEC family transporter [Pseudomonadales bacterium]|nr:AEC family transporter [Pseudomonadales bacterium]